MRRLFLALQIILFSFAPSESSASQKISLHITAADSKDLCVSMSEGGSAPDQLNCANYEYSGDLNTPYYVYLIANVKEATSSISAMETAIQYSGGDAGLKIMGWISCADELVLSATWPEPGSSIQGSWDDCQPSQAVVGAFYVYAYGRDDLSVYSPNNFSVTDCEGDVHNLTEKDGATARFSLNAALPGCRPCAEPCTYPPELCVVSPTSFDFGEVTSSATTEFTLTNHGQVRAMGTVSIVGDTTVFRIGSGGGDYFLAPGGERIVEVEFDPTRNANSSASLRFGTDCPPAFVFGKGVDACGPSTYLVDMGKALVGESIRGSVVLRNTFGSTFEGNNTVDCSGFEIVSGGGAFSLPSGEELVVEIEFTPTRAGNFECYLDAGPFCPEVLFKARAFSQNCVPNPPVLELHAVIGGSVIGLSRIENISNEPIELNVSEVCDKFRVQPNGIVELDPHSYVDLEVFFEPTEVAQVECLIDTGPDCTPLTVLGEAGNPCRKTGLISFPRITVGDQVTATGLITNTSAAEVAGQFFLDDPTGAFSLIDDEPFVLAPGQTQAVNVVFAPTQEGQHDAVVATEGLCSITFEISAFATKDVVISAEEIDLGVVALGTVREGSFTITNHSQRAIEGEIDSDCTKVFVTRGKYYFLEPNQSELVVVRHVADELGETVCQISTDHGDVSFRAQGVLPHDLDRSGPRLAFHTQSRVAKGWCTSVVPKMDCEEFQTRGALSTGYDTYIIATDVDSERGAEAFRFGLKLGTQLSQFGWVTCADLELPSGGWPESGSNLLSWESCQDPDVNRLESQNSYIVGGALYTYAYGSGTLEFSSGVTEEESWPYVTPCESEPIPISFHNRSIAAFTEGGAGTGDCNSCVEICLSSGLVGACAPWHQDVDFGDVSLGSSSLRNVTLVNNGDSRLSGPVSLVGGACEEFFLESGSAHVSIEPGQAKNVPMRFRPGSEGRKECFLRFPGCGTVRLEGSSGFASPCVLDVAYLDFGEVDAGIVETRSFTIENIFDEPLVISPSFLCEENPGFFLVEGGGEIVIPEESMHTIEVGIDPILAGDVRCVLDLGSSHCDSLLLAARARLCELNKQVVEFGTVRQDQVARNSIRIKNLTDREITINPEVVCVPNSNPGFTIVEGGGPVTLIPGVSHKITLEFQGTEPGGLVCQLDFGMECLWATLRVYVEEIVRPVIIRQQYVRRLGGVELIWWVNNDWGQGQRLYRETPSMQRVPISDWIFPEVGFYSHIDEEATSEATTYWVAARPIENPNDLEFVGTIELPSGQGPLQPFSVLQNYPNPFASSTTFEFHSPVEEWARVSVFDLNGREVAQPFLGTISAGRTRVQWNGQDAAGRQIGSGIYLYRVRVGQASVTRRLLFLPE